MVRYVRDTCESVRDFYHDVVAHTMRRTASAKTLTDNPLSTRARKWKKDQAIISLTIGEMEDLIKSKNLRIIAEQKVDGQSAIMEFTGGQAKFASLHDRVYDDLPVLDEIAAILKRQGVKRALLVGEMAVADKGKIVPFEESQSVIKGADRDKSRIHWYPYQILEIDGEAYGEGFETYLKGWKKIKELFKGAERVHPVEFSEGGAAELKSAWKKMVENEQNEGLVVRTSDGRVYKCKPEFRYDLVVIAVGDKKLKNWPKGLIGSTLMAFMDTDKVFRVAGEVGTGLTQAESRELFQWAQKNSVGEDDHYTWVKPEKIMEVQYDRSVVRDVVSYKYENGKYEKVDKRMGGTIIKPRFIRWRDDKKVTPEDLRLTQIPNWKAEKTASFEAAEKELRGLDIDSSKLILVGSAALQEQIPGFRAAKDLDLVFHSSLLPKIKELESRGLINKKGTTGRSAQIWISPSRLLDMGPDVEGISFDELKRTATPSKTGLYLLASVEMSLEAKRRTGRPKDLEDIKTITSLKDFSDTQVVNSTVGGEKMEGISGERLARYLGRPVEAAEPMWGILHPPPSPTIRYRAIYHLDGDTKEVIENAKKLIQVLDEGSDKKEGTPERLKLYEKAVELSSDILAKEEALKKGVNRFMYLVKNIKTYAEKREKPELVKTQDDWDD